MTTIRTNPCQNGGRNRTAGRQDIQGTDHVTTLANAKKIYSNTTDQTRTMAAFMYFVLYEQITGLKASQTPTQQTKPGRWQLSCTLSCTNRSPA